MAIDLYCISKGDPKNPAVLCLHGLLGASRNLNKMVERLAQQGYFAIAYDQRGHGHSPHLKQGNYTLDALSEDVFRVLDFFKVDQAHLVGHSMGGRVVLNATAHKPQRVRSLSLLDVGVSIHPESLMELKNIIQPLPEFFSSRPEAEQYLKQNLPHTQTPRKDLELFLLSNLRSAQTGDPTRIGWAFDLVGIRRSLLAAIDVDQSAAWESVSCPVLIARGARSTHFTQPELDEMLATKKTAQSALVENAGHWLHADNFEGTMECLLRFLNSLR